MKARSLRVVRSSGWRCSQLLQAPQPEVDQGRRHRHAHTGMVLVDANALDLERLAVEEEARSASKCCVRKPRGVVSSSSTCPPCSTRDDAVEVGRAGLQSSGLSCLICSSHGLAQHGDLHPRAGLGVRAACVQQLALQRHRLGFVASVASVTSMGMTQPSPASPGAQTRRRSRCAWPRVSTMRTLAVEARAFVPPALHGHRVHAHDEGVHRLAVGGVGVRSMAISFSRCGCGAGVPLTHTVACVAAPSICSSRWRPRSASSNFTDCRYQAMPRRR